MDLPEVVTRLIDQENKLQDLIPGPYTKKGVGSLADTGYTDGSSCDPVLQGAAVSIQSSMKELWFKTKTGRLS